MAEQVRVTGGGVIPPVPAGATVTEHSRERVGAPANAAPGFTPPAPAPAPAPQEPAPQPAPAAAPAVDPTVAALLAALGGQAAPATAAAPAPVQAPAAKAPAGDAVFASLSGILSTGGVDVNRALQHALEYDDPNLIDRAYIKSVAGASADQYIALAEKAVEHAARTADAQAQACYALAGGESNFKAACGVFQKTAPAHLQAVVTTMLDSGDSAQIEAGAKMIVTLAQQQGATVTPAGLVTASAAPGAEQALSKEQFQAELSKLDRNSRGYEQARGELFGRRAMGKSLGR